MAWPLPKYTKKRVNRAGKTLCASAAPLREVNEAMVVLNNWRSAHGYPINTFQATLREKLKSLEVYGFVSQRLKRTPSIISKLERFDSMRLSRMQDIGGLRVVLDEMKDLRVLEQNYEDSRFQHKLLRKYDYIATPKDSGYRSLHLVYRYSNRRKPDYNGLLLEIQIRTRLQHAWATAVETVGTFLDHSLKASEGPEEWLDYFALVSAAFSFREKQPCSPGYRLSESETYEAVAEETRRLDVITKLSAYRIAANAIQQDMKKGSYHLIVLDPIERKVEIFSYPKRSLDRATHAYTKRERAIKEGKPLSTVLVSAGTVEGLRKAYPSFFLDTKAFLKQLGLILRLAKW